MPKHCTPIFRQADCKASLDTLSEVIARKSNPAILGANPSVQGYSIFCAEPLEVFEFKLNDERPFEKLNSLLSKYTMQPSDNRLFCGGWIGYFGYELGRFIENLPGRAVNDLTFPVIHLTFYDKAIVYDHAASKFYLCALDVEGSEQIEQKLDILSQWLNEADSVSLKPMPQADVSSICAELFESNITQAQYLKAVEKIKQYIYDGDTYQINFSQRFHLPFTGRPIDIFHWQNTFNPSPYAAYLQWAGKAIVSASPELFHKVDKDTITTKPIKGTRPRNPYLPDDAPENSKSFQALVESEKDQAELAMIVDLERNDLARICVAGTRHVTCPRLVEAFPTVYHAAGIIEGKLKPSAGPERIIEILKATFPGGSITGAPKIRSMEIIDELEPTARGIYTGSIGWISPAFDLCWNIAIRTILVDNSTAYVQTGGGIVADSDPLEEWNETHAKARALLAGICAVNKC